MLKVTIFKYAENKLIRTMELGGEPWFVLRDVCEVLSLSTPAKVAERLDMDEVSQAHITDSMGRLQETTIINESGLYNVILRSDKPEAKPFRKWVTAVVLPSIRKNGGYIAGQEELSPQELMAKALLVAQKTIADREARISNLEAQKQAMDALKKQVPMEPDEENSERDGWAVCPSCGEYITHPDCHEVTYCRYCGQAIKWEDEEDDE